MDVLAGLKITTVRRLHDQRAVAHAVDDQACAIAEEERRRHPTLHLPRAGLDDRRALRAKERLHLAGFPAPPRDPPPHDPQMALAANAADESRRTRNP